MEPSVHSSCTPRTVGARRTEEMESPVARRPQHECGTGSLRALPGGGSWELAGLGILEWPVPSTEATPGL